MMYDLQQQLAARHSAYINNPLSTLRTYGEHLFYVTLCMWRKKCLNRQKEWYITHLKYCYYLCQSGVLHLENFARLLLLLFLGIRFIILDLFLLMQKRILHKMRFWYILPTPMATYSYSIELAIPRALSLAPMPWSWLRK